MPGARFAIWTPQHQLLVSVPGSGKVVELTPGETPAAVPKKTVLVSGLTQPQGMAFDTIGGHEVLYVAESDQIDRYLWKSTGGSRCQKVAGGRASRRQCQRRSCSPAQRDRRRG